jgi:hypothetical protein
VGFFSRLRADKQSIEMARETMSQPGFAEMIQAAQQQAAQMQQPGRMQEMMAEAQRAQVIAASGVQAPATIKSIEKAADAGTTATAGSAAPPPGFGAPPPGFGPPGQGPSLQMPGAPFVTEMRFVVEVEPANGTPYEATFTQQLAQQVAEMLAAGSQITVRVDPNDPSSMLFWGVGST